MNIWAITSYFNPHRFANRYKNFQWFRRELNLPLLTVEWSRNADFQLGPDASDILVSVSGGDLMWQKERLLNIAISSLPKSCDVVVWLDCDILFESESWLEHSRSVLSTTPIVQLFSEVVHPHPLATGEPMLIRESVVSAWSRKEPSELSERVRSAALQQGGSLLRGGEVSEPEELTRLAARPSSGHGWAADRKLLDEHRLYDACICGAGDMAIALAALGWPSKFCQLYPLNAHQQKHYLAWAEPFAADVGGQVAFLPQKILHLYHGPLANRQYRTRMQWASQSDFDPARDLSPSEEGPWRWSSHLRQQRNEWMSRFFARRREDTIASGSEEWRTAWQLAAK